MNIKIKSMKKLLSFIVVLVFLLGITFNLNSQISQGGTPKSFSVEDKTKLKEVPYEVMPFVDVEALKKEDEYIDPLKDRPWRFGQNLEVYLNPENSGVWDFLSDGSKIWRLGIVSPGAVSLNLTFDKYRLPKGAQMFIYTPDRKNIIGAFTDFNNQIDGYLATILLPGDHIVIEYYEPAQVEFAGEINLWRVTHGYRGVFEYAKDFGESGSCEINVACSQSAGWENQIRSVAMLVSGGSGFCSGSLINNSNNDGTPYFLSANHCYTNPSTVVFWFNWQSATCSNPAQSPSYLSISGATDKAKNAASDFWLMQLSSAPPQNYNPYYAGWNRTIDNSITGKVVGIHHPAGDIKKISWSTSGVTTTTYLQTATPGDASHWRITSWSDGTTTEGGSSGSPLFDPQGRIIGQLHGGYADCGNTSSDWYGKLGVSWTGGGTDATRLSTWLDPSNTGVTTIDGFDPFLVVCTPPTNQATTFATNDIQDNQISVSWQRGNGDKVIVLAKQASSITSGPYNGVTYNANTEFGSGSPISGAYVVYDGDGTNVTVTGLTPGTQYYFAVYEYFAADHCYSSSPLTGNATTTGTAPCNPCAVSASTDDATGITKVIFNTIDNTSAGTPAYTDFRNISTIVDLGQSYNLTVRVNTAGNYTVKTKAWIDWNNNCTFEISEEYDLGSAVSVTDGQTSLSPKSITVPVDAFVGSVIMRIRAVYGTSANPAACGAQSWSEAEDYTIIVNSSTFEPPTNLTAQLDNKNAILNWTAPTAAGLSGFKIFRNASLIQTINEPTTTTYTDLSLNSGTYNYYVVATYSNPNGQSAPSNTAQVIIPCETYVTFPYSTSFEGDFPPACWTIQQTSTNTWEQITSFTTSGTSPVTVNPQEGTKFAVVKWLASAQDETFISPVFDFTNKQNVNISFWFNGSYYWSVTNDSCDLQLLVRVDNGAWTSLWNETSHPDFTSDAANYVWLNTILDLSAFDGLNNVQFAFKYTGNDGANFGIDNLVLSADPVSLTNILSEINVYPNPTNGKFFVETNQKEQMSYSIFDISGRIIETGLLNYNRTELNIKSGAGIYFIRLNNSSISQQFKVIVK